MPDETPNSNFSDNERLLTMQGMNVIRGVHGTSISAVLMDAETCMRFNVDFVDVNMEDMPAEDICTNLAFLRDTETGRIRMWNLSENKEIRHSNSPPPSQALHEPVVYRTPEIDPERQAELRDELDRITHGDNVIVPTTYTIPTGTPILYNATEGTVEPATSNDAGVMGVALDADTIMFDGTATVRLSDSSFGWPFISPPEPRQRTKEADTKYKKLLKRIEEMHCMECDSKIDQPENMIAFLGLKDAESYLDYCQKEDVKPALYCCVCFAAVKDSRQVYNAFHEATGLIKHVKKSYKNINKIADDLTKREIELDKTLKSLRDRGLI